MNTSAVPPPGNAYVPAPQEAAFLAFSGPMIQSDLAKKVDTIFLSSAPLMQRDFVAWTKKNIKDMTFTPEELDLKTIVPTLCSKTRAHVEGELKVDAKAIADENVAQAKADQIANTLILQGYEGKAFTFRQATVLFETAKLIGI